MHVKVGLIDNYLARQRGNLFTNLRNDGALFKEKP